MTSPSLTQAPLSNDARPSLELVLDNQQTFVCRDGDEIGRAGTVAASRLVRANTLSRKHLTVSWRDRPGGGDWLLTLNPAARNETLLDNSPLVRDTPHVLDAGEHRVDVLGFIFHLRVGGGSSVFGSDMVETNMLRGEGLERLRQQFGDDGLLHLVADHVADLIAIVDEQGKRVWNNSAYYTRLGYNLEEIRRSYSMLEIHPDDQALVKEVFKKSMLTNRGQRIEYRMRHRDGRWLHLESQGSVVQAAGKAAGKYLVLVARDITARKELEQKAQQRTQRLTERTATLARLTQSPEFQEGDLKTCFSQITEAAAKHFGCERTGVWLFSADGASLVCQDQFEPADARHTQGAALGAAACKRFIAELRAERCLAVDSVVTDNRVEELRALYLTGKGANSFLAARICLGNEVLGMLSLEHTNATEPWTLEDQGFAASLADILLMTLQARKRTESFSALKESQRQLAAELAEAASYVRALLPAPMKSGEVESEWSYVPCTTLGGDCFGYEWLDDRHLAIYLLDVVGHGVGAALLSMSALNMLRSRALPATDFREPASVLTALNRAFRMESQGNLVFTIWYGVYDRETRRITHSAAAHPPPVLFDTAGPTPTVPKVLTGENGLMIGADTDTVFTASVSDPLPAHSELYVFSDGAFEITRPDGDAWGFDKFVALLGTPTRPGLSDLDSLTQQIQEVQGHPDLPDDFSILRLVFH